MRKVLFIFIFFTSIMFLTSCLLEGEPGATGPKGDQGEVGPTGPQGISGENGIDGEDGETPYIGSNGNWWIGSMDTQVKAEGVDGKDGETPYIGSNGNWWIGDIDTKVKAEGVNGKDGVDGIDGEDGADGATWISGTSTPSSTVGKENDFYLNTLTWDVYKKTSNQWSLVGNIKGEKGLDGESGEDGEDGLKGETGAQGIAGINGATWITGSGEPLTDSGVNGDLFLDTDSFNVYLKSDNSWNLLGNIKGDDAIHANEKLTVTFDVNGGLLPEKFEQTIEVVYGNVLDLPVPTRENYTFKGWWTGFTANDGQYTSVTPVMSNITLYAKWEMNVKYTIFFETNGGNPISDAAYFSEEEIYLLPDAVKSDSSFVAWYLDSELTNRVAFPLILTENITLYADYKEAEYTVSYNSNGGTEVTAQTVVPGTVIDLPISEKEDYVFKGWYKDSTLTISVGNSIEVHSNMVLYAKWDVLTYTITFASDHGNYIEDTTYVIGTTINELPTPEREDYIFGGWYIDESLSKKVSYPFEVSENIIVYAKWTANFVAISTYEELVAITNMNSNYKLTCDIDCKGKDIIPIGTYDKPFRGTFNGDGYTISNFTITTAKTHTESGSGITESVTGFFGYNCGTINNLKLENFSIVVSLYDTSLYAIGGVSGINKGIIRNCSAKGNIDVSCDADKTIESFIGGIAGENAYTIQNCCYYGNITCSSYVNYYFNDNSTYTYIGGIAGAAYMNSLISTCISGFNANVYSKTYYYKRAYEYVGGICGLNKTEIIRCLLVYGNFCSTTSTGSSGSLNSFNTASGTAISGTNAKSSKIYYGPNLTFSDGTSISKSSINSKEWYTNSSYLGLSSDVWDLESLNYDDFMYPILK